MFAKRVWLIVLVVIAVLLVVGIGPRRVDTAQASTPHDHLGETWDWGTNTSDGLVVFGAVPWSSTLLKVTNTNNGPAIWGENSGGGNAVRGNAQGAGSIGVYGSGDVGPGVVGRSTDGYGVEGYSTNDDAGFFHTASGHGITAKTDSNGSGVYGESAVGNGLFGTVAHNDTNYAAVHASSLGSASGVKASSANGYGVEGYTNSSNAWAPAVYGRSDGASDGVFGLSHNRHGVYGSTKSSNTTHAGVYGTNQGAGPAVYADGDLVVTGALRGNIGSNGGAPFPRPAYDSGWLSIAKYQCHTLNHNLGGNVDNYVVDLQFRDPYGIHNFAFGTYHDGSEDRGACYDELTNQSIQVCRRQDDIAVSKIRVRIWVYY